MDVTDKINKVHYALEVLKTAAINKDLREAAENCLKEYLAAK